MEIPIPLLNAWTIWPWTFLTLGKKLQESKLLCFQRKSIRLFRISVTDYCKWYTFDEFEFLSMALNNVVVLMLACNLHKNAADRYAVNNAQDAYAWLFHNRHAVFHVSSWEFVRCFFHLTVNFISYADYLQLVFFTDKYLCWNHAAFG